MLLASPLNRRRSSSTCAFLIADDPVVDEGRGRSSSPNRVTVRSRDRAEDQGRRGIAQAFRRSARRCGNPIKILTLEEKLGELCKKTDARVAVLQVGT